MPVINILSPHVADLIAAGEVVERPASVVKELVENAIDAGAKNITVEIRSGGMNSIRVTDDGCGMSPEDAGIAFLRHATSKLKDEYGLENIATLGFRGEALAAISAVSRIELTTRERGTIHGTRVTLAAGDIEEMGPVGCPEGTTMLVKDLFYNTPARQKFMKSDRAEGAACSMAALKVALGHPEISVRFLKDGTEEFFSPGDGQTRSTVYSLLGRENAANLLECSGENEGVSVSGFVSVPHAGRGNRGMQFFFINGRSFRSVTLQTALEQAYRNTMLSGRFPACVLYITIGLGKVDVNVHPTKSEVKFTEEKKVYDAVYYSVLSALAEKTEQRTAEIHLSSNEANRIKTKSTDDIIQSIEEKRNKDFIDINEKKGNFGAPIQQKTMNQTKISMPQDAIFTEQKHGDSVFFKKNPFLPNINNETTAEQTEPNTRKENEWENSSMTPIQRDSDKDTDNCLSFRIIGEALDTYIIVELKDTLMLIDKHAVHERMIFDRLIAGLEEPMSQSLLAPVTWSPGEEIIEILEANHQLLESAGFELEKFGEDGIVIRAVPSDCNGNEISLLEEFTEGLLKGKTNDPREVLCHTIACKAAIKAGRRSDVKELYALAENVVNGTIRYCPHGRPVSVKLTKKELDKQFKRII